MHRLATAALQRSIYLFQGPGCRHFSTFRNKTGQSPLICVTVHWAHKKWSAASSCYRSFKRFLRSASMSSTSFSACCFFCSASCSNACTLRLTASASSSGLAPGGFAELLHSHLQCLPLLDCSAPSSQATTIGLSVARACTGGLSRMPLLDFLLGYLCHLL